MEIYSLDLETRPIGEGQYYALEPWRVRQKRAEISSVALCMPNDDVIQIVNTGQKSFIKDLKGMLRGLKGKRVFAHVAIFDVGWLITSLEKDKFKSISKEVYDIRWADTLTLVKWFINGQKPEDMNFSYSLKNLVETFLPDHPMTEEFVKMKSQDVVAGVDEDYWKKRGMMDVIMTRALAEKILPLIPESMRVGLMTEWADIVPVANSWVNGIEIDVNKIEEVESGIYAHMYAATELLKVEGSVLSSPKQLGKLLFEQWGLKPRTITPTGQAGTSGDDIKWIRYGLQETHPELAAKMDAVVSYKEYKTLKSKYIDALKDALNYTGDGYIYGIPKLFGTYTGRMTYANATVKNGPKVSIALHQLPRDRGKFGPKDIRSLLLAPEGFGIISADASGQESRLMAIRSGDELMLRIFEQDLNFHSMTAAGIVGMDYHEFQSEFEKVTSGYYMEQRQLGKLTNLSCNYRIGGKALSEKAFTEYNTYMTEDMGRFLVNTFSRQYPGVPNYWSNVIRFARQNGYTEAFGGRRYKIHLWDEKNRWMSESSAINFPIQGAGASMKEIAISVMTKKLPEVIFSLDLHDAMFNYAKLDDIKEMTDDLKSTLNCIDYDDFWGFEPPISLPYELMTGNNFGEVK